MINPCLYWRIIYWSGWDWPWPNEYNQWWLDVRTEWMRRAEIFYAFRQGEYDDER